MNCEGLVCAEAELGYESRYTRFVSESPSVNSGVGGAAAGWVEGCWKKEHQSVGATGNDPGIGHGRAESDGHRPFVEVLFLPGGCCVIPLRPKRRAGLGRQMLCRRSSCTALRLPYEIPFI